MTLSAPATEAPRSLGQWTERRLRLAILTGELAPGARLAPAELARTWQVSATPLREAIHRLSVEGLVEESRHRGSRVRAMSVEDVADLYEVRLLVEPLALEKSLRASDDAHRAAMRDAHRRWVTATEDPRLDALAVEETHRVFHAVLLERCPSSRLLSMADTLSHHSARYRILAKSTGRGGVETARHEHAALLEACLAGDIALATSRLRDHLELTRDSVAVSGQLELQEGQETAAPAG